MGNPFPPGLFGRCGAVGPPRLQGGCHSQRFPYRPVWFNLCAQQQTKLRGPKMTEPTYDELKTRLAELEAKQKRTGNMSFKVSDKGGVSVYGLGRFPVTLYYEQWMKLLDKAQDLRDFLEENKSGLKLKE